MEFLAHHDHHPAIDPRFADRHRADVPPAVRRPFDHSLGMFIADINRSLSAFRVELYGKDPVDEIAAGDGPGSQA